MDKATFSYAGVGASVAGVIGILGIAAGFLVMRDTAQMEAAGSPDDQPSSSEAGAAI